MKSVAMVKTVDLRLTMVDLWLRAVRKHTSTEVVFPEYRKLNPVVLLEACGANPAR